MKNKETNDFLPTDYVAPQGNSNYFKFEKGENRFRILSKPIIGWLDWNDKTPLRFRMDAKPSQPINPNKPIKHFWAFIVHNAKTNSIQILEITQSSIQGAIQQLSKDADWGAPYGYDIKVVKTGDGMETQYAVNPVPHKPVSQEVKDLLAAKPIDLEKLYDGTDPFVTDKTVVAPF